MPVGMSEEQKKKSSERMKDYWAAKKAALVDNKPDAQVPTVEEVTKIVEKVDAELGGEARTIDEIDKAVTTEMAEVPELPKTAPIKVTYVNVIGGVGSRNFKLSLHDPRRGKSLIDGSRVPDKTLRFRECRYESQSMEERIGIETSPEFLSGEIQIFTPGVEPLYPEKPKIEKIKPPTLEKMALTIGIDPSNEIKDEAGNKIPMIVGDGV